MIRKSAERQVQALLSDLETDDEVRVETTIARLSIIGPRAAPHLVAYLTRSGPAHARAAALRALESCGDAAALRYALALLDADQITVATAAAGVARVLLAADPASPALDRLTETTLNRARPDAVRLAALDALADLPPRTLRPLLKKLQLDESAAVRERAAKLGGGSARPPSIAIVTQASQGELPHAPSELAQALEESARALPLSVLHRLIQAVKDREARTRGVEARAAWTRLRGRVHEHLADRGSRIGLYDVRESVEAADAALPPAFLKALGRIGNVETLESLALAYQRRPDEAWRTSLLETFQTIVRRERLTRRSRALKRALAKSPALSRVWQA